jgi:hypothetical protein
MKKFFAIAWLPAAGALAFCTPPEMPRSRLERLHHSEWIAK